ncbi:MAG: RNB domain-containing ribonuclease [Planctomycetes bacterium]|nr:RNB domain-containing ribonuclease [Planctomycetota bacterium]
MAADSSKDANDPPGPLRSFKDLLRARGGEPEPAPDEGRGWTLENTYGEAVADAEDRGIESSRERITRRPMAFGEMEHGPAAYRDLESEEMRILGSFRIRTVFPDDVRAEADALPRDPTEADFAGRVDLRGATIFTIDGEDAKDYDDAIGIRELADGHLEVGVHIADVGHYVRPGTALDAEALARATSVYLADQVVPMLPEKLSNHLCSLVPHRDRLAYSVFMEFDAKGKRVASRVHKSVIRSVQRNTYRVVQDLLDGAHTPEVDEIEHLRGPLELFRQWTQTQQKLRDAKGSLRTQSSERKFVFDAAHEVKAVVSAPKFFSMALIEETALAANQAVGDLFRKRGLPTIYRVHPPKDLEEIESISKMLAEHGIRVPNKENLSGRDVGQLIRVARNRPNAEALIQRIMGLVERASYAVKDHEDVAKHWGLAREAYLHFTSPIRRYPDLFVHRWLHAIESRGGEAETELRAQDLLADMNDMANHASLQAGVAEMAEQANGDLKVCQFMAPHVGERHRATVMRVSRFGIEVHLPEFNVGGFLPSRTIGEQPEIKGPTLQLRAGRRLFSFTEGYGIDVKIQNVDFIRLQVLLELA